MSPGLSEAKLDPSRIELARHRAGMTKAELARQLAVTGRTISTYESSGAPVSAAGQLSAVLRCEPGFLFRGSISVLEQERVFFRARRRATASERWASVAAGRLGIELYEWIRRKFVLPPLDLPDLSDADPVSAALALRGMWGLGDRALPNMIQLAESRGIRMLSLPQAAEAVDAFSVWSDGLPYIFLARTKTPERARFDIAHELGHLLLHSREGCESEGIERAADQFASAFLMPATALRAVLRDNPSINEILAARTYFRTSAMSLSYAVYQAGRCSEWSYRQNCIQLSQRGFRAGEPGGMVGHERSRVFGQVFRAPAVTALAASELALSAADIHSMTFGMALYALGDEDQPPTVVRPEARARVRRLHAV